MASSCGMLATCSMDGATSAMELGSVHQDGIAAIDELLREAERSRDPAEAHCVVRQSIAWIVASEPFREFIRTTKWADGQQWPVAVISAERAGEMGLPKQDKAGVLRLKSKAVDKDSHRRRWSVPDWDWKIVQEMIDNGESMPSHEGKRAIWYRDGRGKWWLMFIIHDAVGNVYLDTVYRVSNPKYIEKNRAIWKNRIKTGI